MEKAPFHRVPSRVFRLLTVSSVLIGTLALGSLALSSFETPEAVSDAETAVSVSDTTLAATEYIVRYNSNGGYNPPAQQIKKSGETLILTEAVPNSPGWTFCGWSKTADGEVAYKPGARYTSNSSVTLYAVWECNGVYDNLTYSLKKRNGVMTITGQGEMKRREDEPFPWEELCKSITEITIGSGITSIETEAFANASGLEKEGDNLYSATLNSGEFDGIGVDITAGGGYMSTGQLEMSNVDLSSEFTEMITTQRGFQANSRIITVSDTLLEELTNLKR